jgi:phosphomannomutase
MLAIREVKGWLNPDMRLAGMASGHPTMKGLPDAPFQIHSVPMTLSPSIFKAYDIRGVVPSTLDVAVAEALGRAFGTHALVQGERTVAVGRDGRLSGPALSQALMRGLVAAGIEVIDIGMVTTPMLYFAASTVCRSGIQVTGSHNPKDYNGFKMVLGGRAIHGDEIQGLRRIMESGAWTLADGGRIRSLDIGPEYLDRIVSDVRLSRPMKLVVDCGNGVAGASAPALFRALGCEVVELYSEVDGHFPNHHPDPSRPENLQDLIRTLAETGAELGLAFDGDGDRLGIVTRDGQNIYPDRQMILFAQDVLSRVPGGNIIFDVKCSQRLAPAISAAGGQPHIYKTGHSLIKARMKELDSPLGGEMSGHIFFKERWYGFDDGSYAGARLLEILSRSPDASEVLNALPTSCSTPELNVSCAEGEPHRIVARLQELVRFAPPARLSSIDGVRVDWPDGFGLIRASNTTPVLVLRFEGHNEAALERIQRDMMDLLRQVVPDAQPDMAAH